MSEVTLVLVADVPPHAVEAFDEYERHVLPLLAGHGGTLERRLRTADGTAEVHVVSFATRAGYQSYLDDPARAEHRHLVADVRTRVLEVVDAPSE
jgi:hypothetical protein